MKKPFFNLPSYKKTLVWLFAGTLFFLGEFNIFAQCNLLPPASAFTINGNALSLGNNEFRLTENIGSQGGSLWYSNYLNLDQDFTLEFDVFLGSADGGADGMAFVLQQSPQGTAAQSLGGGLGYKGIAPSIAIEFDTWSNGDYNDPISDHIAINKNGSVVHGTDQIAEPVWMSNMEDGNYHRTKITWTASTQMIRVFWETSSIPKIERKINLKSSVFSENPYVYWGWTGSTGMAKNLQKIKLVNVRFKQMLGIDGNIQPSICNGATGAIDFTVYGGVAPFSFSWSNGAATKSLSGLTPGVYSVKVTDACGNTGNAKFTVVSENKSPTIQCPGNITVDNTPGKCGADNVLYPMPSYKGGCGNSPFVQQIEGLPSGSYFPMGTTVNTFVIKNNEGESTRCRFSVTVQ